eukprot:13064117-Alexandrium_andersonii.AAC.1
MVEAPKRQWISDDTWAVYTQLRHATAKLRLRVWKRAARLRLVHSIFIAWATGVDESISLPSPGRWIDAHHDVKALAPSIKQAVGADKL